jgi:hypothetical protein
MEFQIILLYLVKIQLPQILIGAGLFQGEQKENV